MSGVDVYSGGRAVLSGRGVSIGVVVIVAIGVGLEIGVKVATAGTFVVTTGVVLLWSGAAEGREIGVVVSDDCVTIEVGVVAGVEPDCVGAAVIIIFVDVGIGVEVVSRVGIDVGESVTAGVRTVVGAVIGAEVAVVV